MPQTSFAVRMDEDLKIQFEKICNEQGMDISTAISVFATSVVRERRIPFDIASFKEDIIRENALNAIYSMRERALKEHPEGMSLDEINEIISKARNGEDDE